jgi:hypothetical protein
VATLRVDDAGGVVEILSAPGGRWRWAYSDGDTRLASHRTYASRRAAEAAAERAYPRAVISPAPAASASSDSLARRLRPALLALGVIGILLVVVWVLAED